MFEAAVNEELRLWVATVEGRVPDEHYVEIVKILDRLAETSRPSVQPSVFILNVVSATIPPAIWRQRFAEAEKRAHGKKVAFVVVTDSALARGIRTAVNWIAPPPPGFDVAAVSTLDEAFRWIEKRRAGVGLALRGLYLDVEAKMSRAGGTSVGRQQ